MSKTRNKLLDLVISRVYRCPDCKTDFAIDQKATEDFVRKCPGCKSDNIYMQSADSHMSINANGLDKPKTLGSLAEKNTRKFEKEGTLAEKIKADKGIKKKRKKYDPRILKNPTKYILTGEKD